MSKNVKKKHRKHPTLSAARCQGGIHGCGRASPWSASTSDTCRRRKQHLLFSWSFSDNIACTHTSQIALLWLMLFEVLQYKQSHNKWSHTENILIQKSIYMYTHTLVRTYTCRHPWIPLPEQTKQSLQTCVEMGGPIHASLYPCQSIRYSSHSWCSVHLHVLERRHSKPRSPTSIKLKLTAKAAKVATKSNIAPLKTI